jgi:hypothetical protein
MEMRFGRSANPNTPKQLLMTAGPEEHRQLNTYRRVARADFRFPRQPEWLLCGTCHNAISAVFFGKTLSDWLVLSKKVVWTDPPKSKTLDSGQQPNEEMESHPSDRSTRIEYCERRLHQ